MSKKKRLQMQMKSKQLKPNSRGQVTKTSGDKTNIDEIMSILSPTLEPLTSELITELVAKEWEAEKLQEAVAMGLSYNRARDSLMSNEPE